MPTTDPRAVPQQIVAAWADNDADAFAAVFADDATMILPGDVFCTSRDQIRAYMAQAFDGPLKGTRVAGEPLAVRQLGPDAAFLVTKGGVLAPGDAEVTGERAIRATWVLTKKDGGWYIAGYQNTPI